MRDYYNSKYRIYKTYQKKFTSPFLGKFFLFDEDTLMLKFIKPKKSLLKRLIWKKLKEKGFGISYITQQLDVSEESGKHRHAYYRVLRYFDEWFDSFYRYYKMYPFSLALKKSFGSLNGKKEKVCYEDLMYSYNGVPSIFMVSLKFAVLQYVSNRADMDIIIVTKEYVEEVFIELEDKVAGWFLDTIDMTLEEIEAVKDSSIVYNVQIIFGNYEVTKKVSGKIGGYYHHKDEVHIDPEEKIIAEIKKEINNRKEFEKIAIEYDLRKPKHVSAITKLSDLDNVNYRQYSDTTYVLLERFLYKFHTYRDIYSDLMIKLSKSKYEHIILKMPHIKREFIKGSIRMDDQEGLEHNQYNKNIELYESLFSSLKHLENKHVAIAFPFIREESEYRYHLKETKLFLEALNVDVKKFGTLLQSDALSYNVADINRWNKFQFVVIDGNEIFEEQFEISRFESIEYFDFLKTPYDEFRTLHQNLDNRFFEQYFHGYILSQPRLARKMFNSGIKNIILYKSQVYNYHQFIIKFNKATNKHNIIKE